jgi:hypothetical protein
MFKISTCGVGLLLAGLVGLACSNHSGLNLGGGSTNPGQGISGTGGRSGGQTTGQNDCERAGGNCETKSPGGCLDGWSPNTDGYSCESSTTFCCLPLSYSPCETAGGTCVWTASTCPSGTVDNTSQYQWSQYECSSAGGPSICCMPSAGGGTSGVGGTSGGAGSSGITGGSGGSVGIGGGGFGGTNGGTGGAVSCPPALCSIPMHACAGEVQPNPNDPCGCPICVPNPDAGIAEDAGGPDTPPTCPPVMCSALTCPVCPPISRVDSGTATDGGKPDGPPPCRIACPMLDCVGGYLPNPDPCTCPVCAPPPDAGITCADARARVAALCPTIGGPTFDEVCTWSAPECVTQCLAEVSSCSDVGCTFCESCDCAGDRFFTCYQQCASTFGH